MAARRRAAPRFRVAVVGPGALGLFYASRLSRVVQTALIARNAAGAKKLRAGVRVGHRIYQPEAFGRILSLQNGLIEGVEQGVTTAAAHREGVQVVPVATGETLLPPGFGPLARWLRSAGFAARVSRSIDAARYRKLLANVCINPVTAIFGVRNGEVRKPPYAMLAQALAREAAPVISAQGVRISPTRAIRHVMEIARRTAANRSSMLQDRLAGRRTEIEQLNGALLCLAERHGVELPMHSAIVQIVRLMEKR